MTVVNELIDERKVFVQKEDIAEQMKNHFCSLGSKLASCIPDTASQPEDFLGRTDLNFCFRPVNVGYILNLISNLKPSVSCGLDNISSRLLKLCSPNILDSICDIINHVLETGIFPDDWKKAKVYSNLIAVHNWLKTNKLSCNTSKYDDFCIYLRKSNSTHHSFKSK